MWSRSWRSATLLSTQEGCKLTWVAVINCGWLCAHQSSTTVDILGLYYQHELCSIVMVPTYSRYFWSPAIGFLEMLDKCDGITNYLDMLLCPGITNFETTFGHHVLFQPKNLQVWNVPQKWTAMPTLAQACSHKPESEVSDIIMICVLVVGSWIMKGLQSPCKILDLYWHTHHLWVTGGNQLEMLKGFLVKNGSVYEEERIWVRGTIHRDNTKLVKISRSAWLYTASWQAISIS